MPRNDDAFDSLRNATYFSLDLQSGQWPIRKAREDKENTALFKPDDLFEFNVMLFGLSNAPATFERTRDTVLRGVPW